VLNERQAGVAIEGVVRQERIETSQLAVDTHGHTDFAMALARLLGFDLCPRLKDLKQRHLFLARGMTIPAEIASLPHERCAARGAMLRVGDNHGLKSCAQLGVWDEIDAQGPRMNLAGRYCQGCGRTLSEIGRWDQLTEAPARRSYGVTAGASSLAQRPVLTSRAPALRSGTRPISQSMVEPQSQP